jgi:GNAT superfamily N-acetyltransferase
MTNLQAALLYDQLCDIQTILDTKTRIRDRYRYLLPGLSVTTGRWMNVVRLPGTVYSEFAVKLRDYGIDTRPMFYNIHKHKHLQNIPAVSTPTNNDEVFMIPSSPGLSVYDQVFIATILRQIAAGNTPPKIHRITSKNISLLETFIGQGLPSTFRYFATRRADVCLQSHTLTLIATQKGNPIGYAHLDDRWIGLCILPEFQGNGLGSMLMDMILQFAHLSGISPLRLTVDKENERAFQMYKRRGFVVEQVKDTYFYMTNQNDSSSSLCGGSSG